jgi:hypothetical protein
VGARFDVAFNEAHILTISQAQHTDSLMFRSA